MYICICIYGFAQLTLTIHRRGVGKIGFGNCPGPGRTASNKHEQNIHCFVLKASLLTRLERPSLDQSLQKEFCCNRPPSAKTQNDQCGPGRIRLGGTMNFPPHRGWEPENARSSQFLHRRIHRGPGWGKFTFEALWSQIKHVSGQTDGGAMFKTA